MGSKTSAYIEKDALENWALQLNKINLESIDILNSYLSVAKELRNYMEGNVADGFITDVSNLVSKSSEKHLQMQNIEDFLNEVINTMSNE